MMLNQGAHTVGVPLEIRNTSQTPYTGTATGCLNFLKGMVPGLAGHAGIGLEARDPISDTVYPVGYHVTGVHADASIKTIFVGVHGTFAPGVTELLIYPSGRKPLPNFQPLNWTLLQDTKMSVTEVREHPGGLAEETTEIPFLPTDRQFEVIMACETMMEVRYRGQLRSGKPWSLYLRALRGEQGIRYRFVLHNDNEPLWEARRTGRDHKHLFIKDARIISKAGSLGPQSDVHITPGYHPDTDTILGHVGVRWGCKRPVLTMWKEGEDIHASWLNEAGRVPAGKGPYAPLAVQGTPGNAPPGPNTGGSAYEPLSWRYCAIEGGKRAMVEGFLGYGLTQDQIDLPCVAMWEDQLAYGFMLTGGMTPESPDGTYVDTSRERLERQLDAWMKVEDADHLPGLGQIARPEFWARGGTYNRPADLTPFFNWRDFGAGYWGAGFHGAEHYDQGANYWYQFLRDGDRRYLYWAAAGAFQCLQSRFIRGYGQPYFNIGFSYEKGSADHGNYSYPARTHEWPEILCWQYLWEMDVEAKACIDEYVAHMLLHDHFDGDDVPASWTGDSRDWGRTGTRVNRYSDVSSTHGQGWYGDWGIRAPGRQLDAAVKIWLMMGDDRLVAHAHRICRNVVRVETQIWGGHGFIANRTMRAHGVEDGEQPWMAAYLWRGVAHALHHMPIDDGQVLAALHRGASHCASLVAYGVNDPAAGGYVPVRPYGYFDFRGLPTFVMRHGATGGSLALLDAFNADPSLEKFLAWEAAWKADTHAIRVTPELWRYPKYQQVESLHASIDTALRGGVTPTAEIATLYGLKNSVKRLTKGASTSHSPLLADLLSCMVLNFGRADLQPTAVGLLETFAYHHQDGSRYIGYPSVSDSPSDLGYRMFQYPSSETKIVSSGLDCRWGLALFEALIPCGWVRPLPVHLRAPITVLAGNPVELDGREMSDEDLDALEVTAQDVLIPTEPVDVV